MKLFISKCSAGEWAEEEEFPFNSDEYSVGHPTVSEDGKTIYFASDMPGGSGGTDIYTSKFINGQWVKPVILTGGINTEGNEMFPFYDEKNEQLYFASNGHLGLGGLDIYVVNVNGSNTSGLKNLGAPINLSLIHI